MACIAYPLAQRSGCRRTEILLYVLPGQEQQTVLPGGTPARLFRRARSTTRLARPACPRCRARGAGRAPQTRRSVPQPVAPGYQRERLQTRRRSAPVADLLRQEQALAEQGQGLLELPKH